MENSEIYKVKSSQFHGEYLQSRPKRRKARSRLIKKIIINTALFVILILFYRVFRDEIKATSDILILTVSTAAIAFLIAYVILIVFSIYITAKKVKDKEALKRWLRRLIVLIPFFLFMVACSPGKMVGTGYLVTVEKRRMIKVAKVETSAEADRFILDKAGVTVSTDSLIGRDHLYFDMKNGDGWYIYVEKKGIYQRKESGKKRWRMYDEQLIQNK